jgi:hypothetical protein
MSLLQQKQLQKKTKKKVKERINFILSHLFKDKIFLRAISTKDSSGDQLTVYNKKEMFRACEQADFIDCKVGGYAEYASEEYIHDNEINTQTSDFVFFEKIIDHHHCILYQKRRYVVTPYC